MHIQYVHFKTYYIFINTKNADLKVNVTTDNI